MTHSIQYHNDILVLPGGSIEDTFTLLKLRELHAHMEERTVMYQLNPTTVALMDIDLEPDFFLSPSRRPFTIERDKFTAYMDGIKHHELENLEVGVFQKEYLNGQLIISRNLWPERTSDGEKKANL